MMEELKSDSKGTSLEVHSKAVAKIAVMMAERMELINDDLKSIIRKAALLHDIGKCYSEYQNYICRGDISKEFEVKRLLHNEISWAILKIILPPKDEKSQILYPIYWHHSKDVLSDKKEYATAIVKMLSDENIQKVLDFYNYLTGDNKTINDVKVELNDDSSPSYYANKDDRQNYINTAILSCVISADRCVSKIQNQERILTDETFCKKIIDEINTTDKKSYEVPSHYDPHRFKDQLNCVKDIGDSQTTILKAPSGFGKTIVGVVSWVEHRKNHQKLIWVCPTNEIARAVYKNVLDELRALKLDAKVELFLTGVVKERNYDVPADEINDGFCSEIIITNIDNLLAPTLKNYARSRMFLIMSSYVIFDEFHELTTTNQALFACFINIMRVRHKLTNSKTLLLSATPCIVNHYWDGDKITKILPQGNSHYKAPHDKKYKFVFINDLNNIKPENNHLVFTNAIKNTQELCKIKNFPIIAHSMYTPEDRKIIIDDMLDRFGKDKPDENKTGAISALLVQSAMNLSFLSITEVVNSPEYTFQRLGRNNRFGEYDVATFYFCTETGNKKYQRREDSSIKTLYDENLNKLWVEYLKKNINPNELYTLDQLYVLYNDFGQRNEKIISNYIHQRYLNSLGNMSKLFPQKYITKSKEKNNNQKKQSRVGFRDNGEDKIYCIYRIHGTESFTDAWPVDANGPYAGKKEINDTQRQQEKIINHLLKDDRFEYNKHALLKNNRFTSKKLFDMAKNSKTPYINLEITYHPKLGLIDNSLL